MSKRTLFLIFSLFIITFVLLALALYTPSNPKPAQTVTIPKEPIAQTILSFGELVATSSSLSTLSYSIPVNIETGENKVTAVQLELQFDPTVLTNVIVIPGSFFKNPTEFLNQIDTKTGRISYAFGIGLQDQGVMGKGIVATLSFEVKSPTLQKTSILFLPKTLVTSEKVTQTALKTTANALFTVGVVPSITPSNSSPTQ